MPSQKSTYHWLAMDYVHRAERLLKRRLDRHASFSDLTELGNLYLTVENYEDAGKYFEQARSMDQTHPLPYAKLGVIHLGQKRYEKAIPVLQQALQLNPDDLEVKSSLAEANLRAEKLDEAEAAYRQILAITPNHVQSLIGLGELCTARGEKDPDRFSEAIEFYTKALEVADKIDLRSKYLTKHEKAAINYSRGYARVQLYESSGMHRGTSTLKLALQDFRKCEEINPTHQGAIRAIEKIKDRMGTLSPQRLTEPIGPVSIFTMSLILFVAVQLTFFIVPIFECNCVSFLLSRSSLMVTEKSLQVIAKQLPQDVIEKLRPLKDQNFSTEEALLKALQPLVKSDQMEPVKSRILENVTTARAFENFPKIEIGYYSALTFGLLFFMVVGLYLPQVLKLKFGGIELEKSRVDQTQAVRTFGISKGGRT